VFKFSVIHYHLCWNTYTVWWLLRLFAHGTEERNIVSSRLSRSRWTSSSQMPWDLLFFIERGLKVNKQHCCDILLSSQTLSPVHTSNNVEATSSNAYKLNDSLTLSTVSNVASTLLPFLAGNNVGGFGNNVERNFVLSTMSKQIEHVAETGNIVAGQKRQQCRSSIRHCRKDEILQ